MPNENILPNASTTTQFIASILNCEVRVRAAEAIHSFQAVAFANYANAKGDATHFIALDLLGAGITGAALTRFPVALVTEAKNSGKLPENIMANLSEVLNIGVNLLPASNESRLALQDVEFQTDAVKSFAAVIGPEAAFFTIDIPNYGIGTIVLG